ncbi:MAG: glucose-6-phosphate isomerase [Sulfurimonas sp.]|uniref:glucose-6-phosphate isomerase n=1 Tax=Sulfurimonas sp. TaxID=2022749 RepID=UPI0025CF1F95|nr:glucose-6-phosphate isomerase [Sulfurimonas sp.]MCK9490967.1 glucose-6-phosphate isomerase [Sulfurimonas sp.]
MLSFSSHFLQKSFYQDAKDFNEMLESLRKEMDGDEVGYYKLPQNSKNLLQKLKSMDTDRFSQVVIVGIGGSSLGIKAINSILKPITTHAKEMIFFENSDPLTISENISKIDKDRACFFIVSKSGSTIETTSIFKTLIKHFSLELNNATNIYVITDKDSYLSKFATFYNIREFNIPHNVGGRFSVLSAVGVVPLYAAGYDVESILDGAAEFQKSFFDGHENHLLEKANYIYANSNKENINVVFSYADRLENFTKWYVQLWGESLGKLDEDGKHVGLTPIGLIGAVDQHSFLQLIIEGPNDKSVTFINIEDFKNSLSIPDITLHGIEQTDFINKQSFNKLINEQCKATMQSLIQSGVSSDTITLDEISEKNIGAIIIYYELLTSLIGKVLHINTYNQPGVELGKQILYKNLGSN